MRAQFNWELAQWFIGACFAVVVAAHLGAEHLSRKVTILILLLFTYYTAQTAFSLQTQSRYVNAAYQDLEVLSTTSGLSNIAQVALDNSRRQDSSQIPFSLIGFLLCYFSSIGFVVYRHMQYRKGRESEISGT